MPQLEVLALSVIVLAGLYLFALGLAALLVPAQAKRFLRGFASSPIAHVVELSLRLLVGAALIESAHRVHWPGAFTFFGWVLLVSTAVLLALPWRWHQRFAQQTVPTATRFIALIGLASLALGGYILVAVARGNGQ